MVLTDKGRVASFGDCTDAHLGIGFDKCFVSVASPRQRGIEDCHESVASPRTRK